MAKPVQSQERIIPSIHPKTIRPGTPTIITVYQLLLRICSEPSQINQSFESAISQTLNWVQSKFPEKLPLASEIKKRFKCEFPGQRVNCVSSNGFWAVRLEQPDAIFNDKPAVGGRTWTTDVSIAKSNAGLSFVIKVICASLPGCSDPIFLTRPKVVKDIANQPGLIDGTRLTQNPLCIGRDISLDDFYNLVTDPTRTLPIIVLSQPDKKRLPAPNITPYVLDENYLAEKVFSYAHVALLPWVESFNWTNKVGKAWSVYNGAVRVYNPGLDFENSPLYSHPLTIIDELIFWKNPGSTDIAERAFTSYLIDAIQTNSTSGRIDWSNNPFVNEVELMVEREEQEKLAVYLKTSTSDKGTLDALKSQAESREREIELLKKSLKDKENEILDYCDLATQSEKDKSYYEDENKKLKAHINVLRAQLEHKEKKKIDDTIKIPDTLDGLEEWVDKHVIGRLVLHPRAYQGLKKSEYENPALVYKALLLLANQYRDMKIGKVQKEEYVKSRDALQLKDGGSIDQGRAGEHGSTYFVNYPIGSITTRFLENHLRCGGNTRDPKRCLAIYYFWDDDSQQVVVGWLPGHLENRLT
jgi:hypothetical protein